jgi:hypothetical protein
MDEEIRDDDIERTAAGRRPVGRPQEWTAEEVAKLREMYAGGSRLARQDWQKQGYAGLKYINTHPAEAGAPGVKDPVSYIVFDPKHLRSEFAQMDPAMAHSSDLLSGVLPPIAVGGGIMGSLAAGDRYQP